MTKYDIKRDPNHITSATATSGIVTSHPIAQVRETDSLDSYLGS